MTFRWNATDPSASDIGTVYDVGFSTRDGSALTVLDKNFKPITVSEIAYMVAREGSQGAPPFKEATELQEKEKLVQLGTATSIDREFDQWVQNTQGDWSGGLGQRVYGAQSIVNQYFDGEGLLWPLNDYLPMKAMPGPTIPPPANLDNAMTFNDVVGGFLNGAGIGYAYCWRDTVGLHSMHVSFRSGDTLNDTTGVGAGANVTVLAMCVALGYIWVVACDPVAGGNITLDQIGFNPLGNAPFAVDSGATVVANLAGNGKVSAVVTGGIQPGGKAYVAVALSYQIAGPAWVNEVFIYDATNLAGAAITIPLPGLQAIKITDLDFQGANLNIGVSDGYTGFVLQATPPYTTVSDIASLPGLATIYFTAVGGTLFIIASAIDPTGTVTRMDLFTLLGSTLTEIGTIIAPVPFLLSTSSPTTFGGYAFFGVSYQIPGASTETVTVYAFDVGRTRLFRALSFTAGGWTGPSGVAHNQVAVYGPTKRTIASGAATLEAQLAVAIPTRNISAGAEMAREFYWGVVPLTPAPGFTGLLQMGVDLISGIFDFTASTNKLFRQLISSFNNGLVVGQSTPGLILNAWLNQDPGRLNASPDFTISSGTPAAPLPNTIKLPTNEVARKLVYEIISLGGGYNVGLGAWQNAPKVVDVIVQAATGWVWDFMLNLSPNARCNTGDDFCYSKQTPTDAAAGDQIDQVVAYNFLRALWRLKGGECTIFLPNGDTYPALIQLEEYEGPKPFAASIRSDQPTQFQEQVSIKVREDI